MFDTDFIHRNVFTGLTIERRNQENITQFVLGEAGVRAAKDIENLKSKLRAFNKDARQLIESAFSGIKDIAAFLKMEVNETNIELQGKIANKEGKLKTKKELEDNLEKAKQTNSLDDPLVFGCGLLTTSKQIVTKKGDRMAFVQLEDASSKCEVIVFPRLFKKVESWLSNYQVFMVKGGLDLTSQNKCKIKANELVPVELFFQEWPNLKSSFILPETLDDATLTSIKEQVVRGSISLSLIKFSQIFTKVSINFSSLFLTLISFALL